MSSTDENSVLERTPEPTMLSPVVGIGASAGGLEAIGELFSSIPAHTGLIFLVVQHLQPDHESMLVDILSKKTPMLVREAVDGMEIEADHVYVIPPNTSMTVVKRFLVLTERDDKSSPPMPVDDLFESLTKHGVDAIGVVLSGTGSDGALGMQMLKDGGGITFAQDEKSARFNGMPQAAISLGCVDFILPPKQIGQELARIGRHPYLASYRNAPTADEDSLKHIFHLLRKTCQIDFAHYKRGTVTRRLARRLALHQLNSAAEYVALLEKNPEEIRLFCQDLLIRVTSFFRDPATFELLTRAVFPHLIESRPSKTPIRIWVPGCASGEEVYSIAICLVEFLGERVQHTPIQIFGTDINETAIAIARNGRYVENIARDVSEERLKRFFLKVNDRYQISKAIRDLCVFACQDLTFDPPFSRLDMVSCQNLLIYLDNTLQKRVIPLFHYALNPRGVLVLGRSESIGGFSDLFKPFENNKGVKAYTKGPLQRRAQLDLLEGHTKQRPERKAPEAMASPPMSGEPLQREADRLALSLYTPAGVLCDQNLNVLQFRGDTSPFLSQAPGAPSHNLRKLARPELLIEIVNAIRRTETEDATVYTSTTRTSTGNDMREVTVDVIPLPVDASGRSFLIFFKQGLPETPRAKRRSIPSWRSLWTALSPARRTEGETETQNKSNDAEIQRLKRELQASRDYLQTITGQHETASEDLRAAQEELLSSNEEFQSTNEELETAKEELQSTNEELSTTNDELRHRNNELNDLNEELRRSRDYADAIVDTVREPLLVLDESLRVLRANRAFYEMFQTDPKTTEHSLIFEMDERQWEIPALRRLLDEILPTKTESFDYEVTHRFARVGEKTIHFNAKRLDWADHSLILLAIEDITERRMVLKELKTGERRKDEFLAMLGHELRNPLAAIRNALEIWRRGDAGEAAEKQAQSMLDRQLQKETRLVDDLLDVSRITRGIITIERAPVDLVQVVAGAVEEVQHLIRARNHTLNVSLPDAPVMVDGDEIRLEQVVVNLLLNSIKFTETGGRIGVTLASHGSEAVLTITDNGIGIAPELLPQIFDLFVQAERSLDRSQAGLGLGLTLVRHLIQLHGGSVDAKSGGLRQGCEFSIRLPLMTSPVPRSDSNADAKTHKATAAHRVLVVDDNVDAAESLALLLRMEHHHVEIAYDGEAAVRLARTFKPEIVLLDVGLPGIDGYEVARQLRTQPATSKALLIAVSGYGRAVDHQRSKAAGFDHHLVKPVHPDRINDLIADQAPSDSGSSP